MGCAGLVSLSFPEKLRAHGFEAPCYVMRFDKSGEIVGKIKRFIGSSVQR